MCGVQGSAGGSQGSLVGASGGGALAVVVNGTSSAYVEVNGSISVNGRSSGNASCVMQGGAGSGACACTCFVYVYVCVCACVCMYDVFFGYVVFRWLATHTSVGVSWRGCANKPRRSWIWLWC